jgi:hypothetical protein
MLRDSSELIDLAVRFRRHSEPFRSFGLKGQADLYAKKGREAWGIWRLIPGHRGDVPARNQQGQHQRPARADAPDPVPQPETERVDICRRAEGGYFGMGMATIETTLFDG